MGVAVPFHDGSLVGGNRQQRLRPARPIVVWPLLNIPAKRVRRVPRDQIHGNPLQSPDCVGETTWDWIPASAGMTTDLRGSDAMGGLNDRLGRALATCCVAHLNDSQRNVSDSLMCKLTSSQPCGSLGCSLKVCGIFRSVSTASSALRP